jgi:hypothetical protein
MMAQIMPCDAAWRARRVAALDGDVSIIHAREFKLGIRRKFSSPNAAVAIKIQRIK